MNRIKSKKPIIAILVILILSSALFLIQNYDADISREYFIVDENEIVFLMADTPALRMKGLGDVPSLADNTAMLFVFDKPDTYGIWMKNMKFSIDIIWLDEENRVVSMEQNVSPDTYPRVFYPTAKSLYVIEGNAGFVVRNAINVGNILNLGKK